MARDDDPSAGDEHEPRGARPTRRSVGIGLAALAVLVLVAALAFRLGGAAAPSSAATATATPSATASADPTVAEVYQSVAPSVVVVQTADGALGAGVVAADDGSILTAAHVVDDGSAVTVTFSDGTESTATVASTDASTDIATLSPATLPETLVPATLGGEAAVGDAVIAIGNPLGLAFSVSSGIVSGLDRSTSDDTDSDDTDGLTGLIQFDAAVNPGSSGGPLLNAQGVVIGIVVSIADPGGDDAFAGIGFAVPIGTALGSGGGGEEPQL
ncbi:MAG: trypsin-like peptidase domain-containing protein [Microbacteriaceae bacterium]